jgi:dolichyl-phosphate beta-glucosyltransferase
MRNGAPFVSVVIPAFNEEARISATLETAARYLDSTPWRWELRVVDDGSSDGTVEICRRFHETDRRVVVQEEPHRGKGGAVKAGMLAAPGEYRFICDADLSMPIEQIAGFLPPLKNADIAIATREGAEARRIGEPLRRHLVGRVFNHLVQQVVLPGVKDTQCGFKMFTARAADLLFPLVTIDGWGFDIEVLCVARQRGLRIVEVPIEWHYRRDSRVSLLRDSVAMFRELLLIRRRAKRGCYLTAPGSS